MEHDADTIIALCVHYATSEEGDEDARASGAFTSWLLLSMHLLLPPRITFTIVTWNPYLRKCLHIC